MASPTLHLIGNDAAAPQLIVRWCLERWPAQLPQGLVFCVPTSLAMRRLRDALTETYHAFHGVRFTLPAGLFSYFAPNQKHLIATETEMLCAWDKVFDWLQTEDADNLVATYLFPSAKKWLDKPNSRYTVAKRLIRLRATLVEATLDFAGVHQHPVTATLDERERNRWAALDALEQKYREVIAAAQLLDPSDVQLQTLQHPVAQPIESQDDWHLVVACVPDFMPSLETLFSVAPICDILIQSEQVPVERFTTAGTPAPNYWNSVRLSLANASLELAETPAGEALSAERFLATTGEINPADICLCVLNHEVMPPLTDIFEAHDIKMFEPDPIRLESQPAVKGLCNLFRLTQQDYIEYLSPLFSLPEIATYLKTDYVTLRAAYLTLIEQHQPGSLKDAIAFTEADTPLHCFLTQLQKWKQALLQEPCDGARSFLIELFGTIFADPVKDALLFSTFEALQSIFHEIETVRIPDVKASIALLDARIRQTTLHPIRGASDCSYEGRFEILWSPASRFVLAGLNEGIFPDTVFEDPFLPNEFRVKLGLRSDKTRLARDAYLLETLCQRIPPKDVKLLCSKVNVRGDWLKPSRLFFRCTSVQLVERARQFFLTPSAQLPSTGADSNLALTQPLHLWRNEWHLPKRLSASAIRTFLHSPATFFLEKILHLTDTELTTEGVPANVFGTLLHDSLEILRDTKATDAATLEALLHATFLKRFAALYGTSPSVELAAVRHAALKRLSQAAECEAKLRAEGWETRFVESETFAKAWEVTLMVRDTPITLYGKIDRIDYHAGRDCWRIIDYKTGGHAQLPEHDHFDIGAKNKVKWHNFQLPIYRLLARQALKLPSNALLELAYFALPADGKTAVNVFRDPVSERETEYALKNVLETMLDFANPETLYESASTLENPLLRHLFVNTTP